MSDKPTRSLETIQQEYTNVCAKLGHINFQISSLTSDATTIAATLKDLNFEAIAAQAKAKEEEVKS